MIWSCYALIFQGVPRAIYFKSTTFVSGLVSGFQPRVDGCEGISQAGDLLQKGRFRQDVGFQQHQVLPLLSPTLS